MGELEERINEIRESNLNADVPPNVIHSLNDMIIEGALSTVLEFLSQRVEELSQVICTEWFANDDMETISQNYRKDLILLLYNMELLLSNPLVSHQCIIQMKRG